MQETADSSARRDVPCEAAWHTGDITQLGLSEGLSNEITSWCEVGLHATDVSTISESHRADGINQWLLDLSEFSTSRPGLQKDISAWIPVYYLAINVKAYYP